MEYKLREILEKDEGSDNVNSLIEENSLSARLKISLLRRISTLKKGYAKSNYDGASSYGGDGGFKKVQSNKQTEDAFLA